MSTRIGPAGPVARPVESPARPEDWNAAQMAEPFEAAGAAARLAASAAGEHACARVLSIRGGGDLRPLAEVGDWGDVAPPPDGVRERPLRAGRRGFAQLRRPLGFGLLVLPLTTDAGAWGVLEVAAPSGELEGRLGMLEAVADVATRLLAAGPGEGSAAESLEERLDMGMAWTAHELRAPLLGAKAVMGCVRDHGELPEDLRDLLRRSEEELAESFEVVDALLRWGVGAGRFEPVPVDLARLVDEAVSGCRIEPGRPEVTLRAAGPVWLPADRAALRAAIGNLIRNALAHARSEIRVNVEARAGMALVSVADDGPGIPGDEQEAIFGAFVRGTNGRRSGGGLGLFIARRIVEAHGGRIWAESSDRGSTFRVLLPEDADRWTSES